MDLRPDFRIWGLGISLDDSLRNHRQLEEDARIWRTCMGMGQGGGFQASEEEEDPGVGTVEERCLGIDEA